MRKETETAFAEVQRHLSAHAVLNASPAYDQLINELDQLTQTYNQVVKNRAGRNAADEEEEPDTGL